MLHTISFKKHLCNICLESFSLLHLKRVKDVFICPACLKLISSRQKDLQSLTNSSNLTASENYPRSEHINLSNLISQKGELLLDEIKSASKTITIAFVVVIFARSGIYLGGSFYLDPEAPLTGVLSGAMLADLTTWFAFNILQIPFIGTAFLTEFVIYSVVIGLIAQNNKLHIPVNGEAIGIACLTAIAVGVGKTIFWAAKIATVNNE